MKRLPIILLAMMLCSGCGGGLKPPQWLIDHHNKKAAKIKAEYTKRFEDAGATGFTINVSGGQGWLSSPLTFVEFSGPTVTNLPPMAGMRIRKILLKDDRVSDLTPLRGASLSQLIIIDSTIDDLSPLNGMEFDWLTLKGTGVTNLPSLQDSNLKSLHLVDTLITDVTPLEGLKLNSLSLASSGITDISPIKEMKLSILNLRNSGVTDVSALTGSKLSAIYFTPKNITNGIDILRNMTSLEFIGTNYRSRIPPADFWVKYDAGEYDAGEFDAEKPIPPTTHVLQKGETLSLIAKYYYGEDAKDGGTTILEANPWLMEVGGTPHVGKVLQIPKLKEELGSPAP